MSLFRLSRRLGFGLSPGEAIPADFKDWAYAQLENYPALVGIETNDFKSPVTVSAWPDALQPSIEKRFSNTLQMHDFEEQLSKKIDPSTPDFIEKVLDNQESRSSINSDIAQRLYQGIYGSAPVHERFCHFWANHFTVGGLFETDHLIGHFLDQAIRANLTSTFEKMLFDVIAHPAMLTYLDNVYSIGPNSPDGRAARKKGQFADINENLGRELLELYTVTPSAGYNQADVVGAAGVLTGWGFSPLDKRTKAPSKDRWRKNFLPARHEPGEKTVLGVTFKEGKAGLEALTVFLAKHEHTVLHLSAKLARYFIAENPEPAIIAEIVKVWTESGGDLPSVHKTVVRLAEQSAQPVLQQPEVWWMQVLRISGSDVLPGYKQVGPRGLYDAEGFLRDPRHLLRELGQFYWVRRQPNGYSDARADWISPEHFERRLRYSEYAAKAAKPKLTVAELMDRMSVTGATRALVANAKQEADAFVLLFCSPEMIEA